MTVPSLILTVITDTPLTVTEGAIMRYHESQQAHHGWVRYHYILELSKI